MGPIKLESVTWASTRAPVSSPQRAISSVAYSTPATMTPRAGRRSFGPTASTRLRAMRTSLSRTSPAAGATRSCARSSPLLLGAWVRQGVWGRAWRVCARRDDWGFSSNPPLLIHTATLPHDRGHSSWLLPPHAHSHAPWTFPCTAHLRLSYLPTFPCAYILMHPQPPLNLALHLRSSSVSPLPVLVQLFIRDHSGSILSCAEAMGISVSVATVDCKAQVIIVISEDGRASRYECMR